MNRLDKVNRGVEGMGGGESTCFHEGLCVSLFFVRFLIYFVHFLIYFVHYLVHLFIYFVHLFIFCIS